MEASAFSDAQKADANGPPISLFMTAVQVSDYIGAAALLDSLPRAQWLLGDRGGTDTLSRPSRKRPSPSRFRRPGSPPPRRRLPALAGCEGRLGRSDGVAD